MGALTRTELIAAGMGKAGFSSTSAAAVAARVVVEFQAWLDRQYNGWTWPFLKKRVTGLSLSAGATSLTVGSGSGGVTREIIKLISPVLFYTSDKAVRGKAPIVQSAGDASLTYDETLADSSTFRGSPQRFKARHGTTRGTWDLVPLPFPDRALLLALDYYERPAALSTGTIPIYPEDETLISAIQALTLVDQKGIASPEAQAALDDVASRVSRDRATHASVAGDGDVLVLDSSVFL